MEAKMTPKSERKMLWLLAVLCCCCWAAPSTAVADERGNRVTGLEVEEAAEATLLRIRVAHEPTFSVFKLRNPARLLIEVSDCADSDVQPIDVRNGVVDRALVTNEEQGRLSRCRVVVSFDRVASYDVQASEREIVVSVDGAGRLDASQDAESLALIEKLNEREAELDRTRSELGQATHRLEELQLERQQSITRVKSLEAREAQLEGALAAGEERTEELATLQKQLAEERGRLEDLADTTQRTSAKVQHLGSELSSLREQHADALARIEDLSADRDAEAQRASLAESRADALENKVAKLELELDAKRKLAKEAERLGDLAMERDAASQRAQVAEMQARELESEIARLQHRLELQSGDSVEVERLSRKLEKAESEAHSLQSRVDTLREQVAQGQSSAEVELAEKELALAAQKQQGDSLQKEIERLRLQSQAQVQKIESQLTAKASDLEAAEKRSVELRKELESRIEELNSGLAERDKKLAVKEAELKKLRTQQQALARKLDEARTSSEGSTAELEKEIAQLRKSERKLAAEMEAETLLLRDALADREAALKRAREREGALQRRYEELQGEREKEQIAVTTLIENKEGQIDRARQIEAGLREEIAALKAELGGGVDPALEATLQEKQSLLKASISKQEQLEDDVEGLTGRLKANRAELERVKAQAEREVLAAQQREEKLNSEITRLSTLSSRSKSQLQEARKKASRLEGEVVQLQEQLHEVEAQASSAQAELEQLRTELARAEQAGNQDQEVDRLRHQLAEAEAAQGELEKLRVRLSEAEKAEAELERLRSELARAQNSGQDAEIERLQARLAKAEAAQDELGKLRVRLSEAEAAQDELGKLRARLSEAEKAEAELARLEARLSEAEKTEARLLQLQHQLARAEASQQSDDAEIEGLRQQLTEAESARDEAASLRKELEVARHKAAELETLQARLVTLEAEAAEARALRGKLADKESELEALRERVAQLESGQKAEKKAVQKRQKVAQSAKRKKKNPTNPVAHLDLSAEGSQGGTPPIDTSVESETRAKADTASASEGLAVDNIRFERSGNYSRVLIDVAGDASYHTKPWMGGKARLVIEGADLPEALSRKLDTRAFQGPVHFVSAFSDGDGVQLVADLDGAGSEVVRREGNTLIWEFADGQGGGGGATTFAQAAPSMPGSQPDEPPPFVDRRKRVRIASAPPEPSASATNNDDIRVSFGKRDTLKRGRFARQRITLDVRQADINDLLRLIADEAGVSIVTSADVSGRVTLSLKSVPLRQALDIILRSQDLGMKQEGNIIWVAPAEVFREEQRRALEASIVREQLEPLEVRLIPVNYATADELLANVQGLLSERGSALTDARTNTLIIKDVGANLDAVEILVESLDTQTPQILIEARIVETSTTWSEEIGIQWGGDFSFSQANGNPTGLLFPSTIGVAGGSSPENNQGTSPNPNFAVNLPAPVGVGSGAAVGMTLGSAGGAVNLNIRLTALEDKGYIKIVSAPRIMTIDNVEARIEQGVQIPVSVVSAAGVQTVFFNATLLLQVTPHVTKDGYVFMDLTINKDEPNFAQTGAQGDPSITTKQVETQLLVKDGDTTVIGGIYTRNRATSTNTVPWFGEIPFLGYFFRKTSETDDRTEMLVFVTPRIINRDLSIGSSGPGSFVAPIPGDEGGN